MTSTQAPATSACAVPRHRRGPGTRRFLTCDRHHLATVAQEGMIRAA